MKKFFDFFKPKKSDVVEELTKNFDKKLEASRKSDGKYQIQKNKEESLFYKLMNDDFYNEINDLMLHFEKKLNQVTKAQKCGYKVDKQFYTLEFYSNGYDNFPIGYRYLPEDKKIFITAPGNDNRLDKEFSIKQSREAEKYFLKLMTKHMESKF